MKTLAFTLPIAMVMALVPLALDLYLPAMPEMAVFFGVGADAIATTVSFFVFGVAGGQLVGGPLSDRIGRREVILLGLAIFSVSSFAIAMADDLNVVRAMRVVQALGGGFTAVCVPALIRDRASGTEAAKLFSLVGLIMIAVPAAAPALGSLILIFGTWKWIFAALCFAAVLMMVVIWLALPPAKRSDSQIAQPGFVKRYLDVFSQRAALPYMAAQALAFSVLITFVTNASFIYQDYLGLEKPVFAALFSANIVMLAIMNRLCSWLLGTRTPQWLLRLGLSVQLGAVMLLVVGLMIHPSVWLIAPCIILAVGSHGMIVPNSGALYMSCFSRHAGSASALLGAAQYTLAGITGGLSTQLHDDSILPVALTMLALSVAATAIIASRRMPDGGRIVLR